MNKLYQITEYGSFVRGKNIDGYQSLPERTFDILENFILVNNKERNDALEIMRITACKGIGKIITARNYVGVISMLDGTTIEILPKIYSHEEKSTINVKKLLVDMLKTMKDVPYKNLQRTNVDIEKMNIFEIFIKMFIQELYLVVKKGLKCNYHIIESNEYVFKGKMKFEGHIKNNYVHKERNYVEYDEFNINRSENKILKATLRYLYRNSASAQNKKDINTLLNYFMNVDDIYDFLSEFEKINIDRNTQDYTNSLAWSKVFLMGKSFTAFAGSEITFALLFPMEKLFESYIAIQIRKYLNINKYRIQTQDCTYHLFDLPKKFSLKPDIVIQDVQSKKIYIIDTKWKKLSNKKTNYGILQSDMYQMYAYHKKYSAENVTLLYPWTDEVSNELKLHFESDDHVKVKVVFANLYDIKSSIKKIIEDIGCL